MSTDSIFQTHATIARLTEERDAALARAEAAEARAKAAEAGIEEVRYRANLLGPLLKHNTEYDKGMRDCAQDILGLLVWVTPPDA